jgi:tetratricopeptide (TPR) repeat protein
VLTSLCFILAWTIVAHADPALDKPKDPKALEHLVEGNRQYKVQNFEQALAEYKAGALVEAAPLFDYNLGQCYRMLGRYKEAIWQYERFLRYGHPTDQELVDHVNDWLKQMHAELDRKAMTLTPTDPAPVPTPVPKTIVLVEPSESWYEDKLGWGLVGAGAIAAGVSAYLLHDASSLNDQANHDPDQMRRHDLQSRAGSRNTAGIIIGVGALGVVATGVVKLAITKERKPPRTVTTSWVVGVRLDGFVVGGQF